MNRSIDVMAKKLYAILGDNMVCIYLYGSVALEDFKLGWSDIDILCLTKEVVSDKRYKYEYLFATKRLHLW